MDSRLWLFWRCASVSVHMIAVAVYGFALIFQFIHPWGYYWKENDIELSAFNSSDKPIPAEYSFGWRYKFLTYWNLNFQFFIFFLCLVCDCLKVNYLPSKAIQNQCIKHMFRIRDVVFHSVLFPIGWFVFSIYWILYAVNREMVENPKLSRRNPWWLTHITHTMLAPILILETTLTYHRRTKLAIELPILLITVILYLIWTLYLGLVHQMWIYGVLRKADTIKRGLFMAGFTTYSIALYFFGKFVHKLLWSQRRVEQWPKQWSADVISKDHEFEDFRIRQGLLKDNDNRLPHSHFH